VAFNYAGLMNVGQDPSTVYATTVPHYAFVSYQMMFAIITIALITGAVVERVKFKFYPGFRGGLVHTSLYTCCPLGLERRRLVI